MDLPLRNPGDVQLPDGSFTTVIDDLRKQSDAHDLRIGIFYAFDFRTRMLPYWYADKRMAPCSVRLLGDSLNEAGFKNVRIVLQQWSPNVKPSEAMLDGKPLDIVLVSSMQVHAEPSYDLVRDAHRSGEQRPWILAGGPKAIYEPTDYFELGDKPGTNKPGISADCVCTGEAYVFLDLFRAVLKERRETESPRAAFDRLRETQTLNDIPGLVYMPKKVRPDQPYAINTGIQRLVRDLDEYPMPDAGYRMLEPIHKRSTLAPKPYSARKVGKVSIIASVIGTHGCKFNCEYCPIPAVNQRTWRHKSPERLAAEIKHIRETFGIREFFGTDDNFFNDRETVIALMTALSEAKTSDGKPLRRSIAYYTEATQFDVFKNRDLLPLCRKAGLRAIWFGIEDITAELINKGQDSGNAADLFQELCQLGIQPMAMLMHNDDQPLRSPKGDLAGVINQAKYLFDSGAVSYQCTYIGPAIGTREIDKAIKAKTLYKSVGGEPVPQAYFDGNHVVASRHTNPGSRQMNVIRAYFSFYNPLNVLRIFLRSRKNRMLAKRILFQIIGQVGLLMTAPKLIAWSRKIARGPIEVFTDFQRARIPMVDAHAGHEIFWSIKLIPAPYLPQEEDHRISHTAPTRKTTKTAAVTAVTQVASIKLGDRTAPLAT